MHRAQPVWSDTNVRRYSRLIVSDRPATATSNATANVTTIVKSGKSPILLACTLTPAALVVAWSECVSSVACESGGGTCGVCAGDVGGEVYHGHQSAHVEAVSRLGCPGGIVKRVESGRDEPREDVHERVDEEIDAAQLDRVAKVDATATQQRLVLSDTVGG